MLAYQCDFNGYYVGEVEADESPLEPGVWLIPGGAVLEAPPAAPAGFQPRWVDGEWLLEALPPGIEPFVPSKSAILADIRWQREVGGITLPNGAQVVTTRESQAQIGNAIASLQLGLVPGPLRWKLVTGWVDLGLADLMYIGSAIGQHVQRCFLAEEIVLQELEGDPELDVGAAFQAAFESLEE